ncbi:uncharacterized protein LOC132616715 [Lycium barbarum]|uniref:uncharacterized protein LOC132616715 n=1 Tax=Lycium barbarum TaxID=112863 RepID=UPI00293EFE76|nr:uncharacterized protein LOC132616715 [Lycium barbarum]
MAGRANRNNRRNQNQEGLQINPPALVPVAGEDENVFTNFMNDTEYAAAVVPPRVGNSNFKVESHLYHLLKLEGYFKNSSENCPLHHLKNFLHVCTQQTNGAVHSDALRLRFFKYSLIGEAREWYEKLPSNSIHTWAELFDNFLKKWFPPSKKAELRDKIFDSTNYQANNYTVLGIGSNRKDYNNNNYGNRNSNAYVPPKGQSYNSQNWREGPSNDQGTSRMESMLEKILENQNKSDKKMKNLTEVVGSRTASIQKLESQIRDLSREQHPPQRGGLPSDTIPNPRGNGGAHIALCKAISTRSGKILNAVDERVVEPIIVEPVIDEVIEEEIEAPIKVPIIIEKEKVAHPIVVEGDEVPSIEKATEGSTQKSKDLLMKKIPIKHDTVGVTHRVSSIISSTKVEKKGDPGAFTIPCTIGHHNFACALCDNGASINLMPLAIFKQSRLGTPRPMSMRLQMANRTIKRPVGVVDDVLVRVGEFLLPTDFVILDCEVDKEVSIILRRPFLATGRALMDSKKNEIKF